MPVAEAAAPAVPFQINVDKYDADNQAQKLEGAAFVLDSERTENDKIVKYYAQVVTEEMIAAGTVINGTAVDADDLGVFYGWTTDEAQASVLDTDARGSIELNGLDSGIYYLKETKAPDGYNKLTQDITVVVKATTVNDQKYAGTASEALTKLEITAKRTTREKLLAYLYEQEKFHGKRTFTIPFDRQALADYLGVERSAMSAELSKLQKEGLIRYQRSSFELMRQ